MKTPYQNASVAAQIAALPTLKMPALWALWDTHFAQRPAHHNRDYLESHLAYRIQEIAFGGLKHATRDQLIAIGEAQSAIKIRSRKVIQIVPGTVLVREYGEREYRVLALPEGGFECEGRPFKTLSAVARFITGSHLSGPAFFGLRALAGGAT